MTEVIDFFFSILRSIWALISQYWILSFAIILFVIDLVVTIINGSSGD